MVSKKLSPCKSRSEKLDQFNSKSCFVFKLRTNKKLNKHSLKVFIRVHAVVDGFPCTRGVVACRQLNECFLVRNVEGFVTDARLGFLKERTGSAAICRHDGPL